MKTGDSSMAGWLRMVFAPDKHPLIVGLEDSSSNNIERSISTTHQPASKAPRRQAVLARNICLGRQSSCQPGAMIQIGKKKKTQISGVGKSDDGGGAIVDLIKDHFLHMHLWVQVPRHQATGGGGDSCSLRKCAAIFST